MGTKIEWAEETWNCVTGCTRVSEGCDHCYIERTPPFRMQHRSFDKPGVGGTTGVKLHSERLHLPLRWKKPCRVFVNSLADLFHDEVPDQFIAEVFAVMALARQHTFQLLTKRHARLKALLAKSTFPTLVEHRMYRRHPYGPRLVWPLPNAWIGVSVESQQWADIRIPTLLETPAAVRWLSCEPLLGPVDLDKWLLWADGSIRYSEPEAGIAGLDWIVCGGESGPGARPMHPNWARRLRDQCAGAGVPFFFKQFGEYGQVPKTLPDGRYALDPGVTVADDGTVYLPGDLVWPDGLRVGEALRAGHDGASLHAMYRVGKKAAGRELDGREWNEYPGEGPL